MGFVEKGHMSVGRMNTCDVHRDRIPTSQLNLSKVQDLFREEQI